MCCQTPSAPAPPDTSALASANLEAARMYDATSRENLQWAKDQYADIAPYTKHYLDSMTAASDQQMANAQADRARYERDFQPVEDKFLKQTADWNSPDRADREAGGAMADVATQFNAARANALSNLESYGIDPSQTRYGALDLGTRVSQAAAEASAGTQSRRNTEATGMALEGEAINIGRGYPGQVAQSYSGAQSSGGAALGGAMNTSATYGNLMGNPATWAGAAGAARGGALNATMAPYQGQLQAYQAQAQMDAGQSSGMGSLIGGVAAIGGAIAI